MSDDLLDALQGLLYGALIGSAVGFGVYMWRIDAPFFPRDTILLGGAVCGVLGFFFGERFLDWIKEICMRLP